MRVKIPDDLASKMKSTGVWRPECPVSLERLALVQVPYVDFDGAEHTDGELIVLDVMAENTAAIFSELYKMRFPINKIKSIHHYEGDDLLSMEDNNTSGFNFRTIADSMLISLHSWGLAIDINPLQNPIIYLDSNSQQMRVSPKSGKRFIDRQIKQPGMIEEVVSVFSGHGFFIWGGEWTNPIDLHHFQLPRSVAQLLIQMNQADAKQFLEMCTFHQDKLKNDFLGEYAEELMRIYKTNQSQFFDRFLQIIVPKDSH